MGQQAFFLPLQESMPLQLDLPLQAHSAGQHLGSSQQLPQIEEQPTVNKAAAATANKPDVLVMIFTPKKLINFSILN